MPELLILTAGIALVGAWLLLARRHARLRDRATAYRRWADWEDADRG